MKQKKINLIVVCAALACLITLVLLHILWYKGLASLFPIAVPMVLLLSVVFRKVFRKKADNNVIFWPAWAAAIVVSIVLFVLTAPPVSYPEAKKIALDSGLTDLVKPPFDVAFASELPQREGILGSYMFMGKLHGQDVYFLVSPIDGSVQVEAVGESYLDEAIRLKEMQKNK
ncbi:MAG: hypothetical protein GX090_08860 [Firmicutes bacterium]|nr:hypothetical protein [Bacillota bacterium]HOB35774.1 hypothetical protein [Bacillota bacterium]HPZ90414.1 hypothetical protein [Bacillota bacterium]HQE02512.1 hypothetical protein [Bacillota bacterium]